MSNNGDKQHRDQASYELGLKDERVELLVELIEFAETHTHEETVQELNRLLEDAE